ncbi:unnamed protein product [Ectocarpus sp. CCAP 1310/34]|nr:unnamed protein product [Ectocarpus sp. CCAP 1310/34]
MGVTEQTGQRGVRWAESQTYNNKSNSKSKIKVPNTATQQSRHGGHKKRKEHSTAAEGI